MPPEPRGFGILRGDFTHDRPLKGAEVLVALVSMAQLLGQARRSGYAVCYCESWNFESFVAVVEAAEELESPIIYGFNGGFLGYFPVQKWHFGLTYVQREEAR